MLTLKNSKVSEVTEVQPSIYAVSSDTSADFGEVSEVSDKGPSKVSPPVLHLVPGETERPKFVVFDDWHDEDGFKYRPGVWHFGLKDGHRDTPSALTQQWICSPLHVDAVTTDAHEGNYGRLLRIKTTRGKWTTWAMPMMMLRGDCSDLRGELLSMGVEIDHRGRYRLAEYLQNKAPKRRIECVHQTGWAGTHYQAFVLPDAVIGPMAAGVGYQSGERGSDEYATAGTLAGWKAGIAAMAVGNPLLVLGLCAAFAGPVLSRCGQESGGIHFVGDSSTGKTTIIEAACSVWGSSGYRRSWRTTGNGLEGAATLFNDALLALDEISECDPRQVGEVVYMLGNGRGKQRASRTGSARTVAHWRCSVLSTGERTIATTMTEGGHRVKAGQSVRLLDVPAQRMHGAWDDLHQLESGTVFSDAIKRAAATHYGHAGRAFLEKLTRDHEASFSEALDAIKARPEFQTSSDEGQAKRAVARFAVLALAGEMATDYGVTGWQPGEAIRAAAVGFAAWQSLRGAGRGNAERDQIVERIVSFIERHGDSRFSDANSNDDLHAAMVRDRAGWWRAEDGGRAYLFIADGMREALKGFDFARALDVLQQVGAIEAPGTDGKRAKYMRIRGRGMKLYTVRPDRIEGDV